MEKVADLLARKHPQFNTTTPTCLVSDALYKMCCENVDYLIVSDDNRFKGVITDHDIASRILFEERPLKEIRVHEFMNTTLPVVTPTASLQNCLQLAERFGARHLAVYDRFEFKGVLSLYEIMQEALHQPAPQAVGEAPLHSGYPWTY